MSDRVTLESEGQPPRKMMPGWKQRQRRRNGPVRTRCTGRMF